MTRKSSNLKVVKPSEDHPETPRPLGPHGLRLWRSITEAYTFDDPGSSELLLLCCEALDRAEAARLRSTRRVR